MIQQPQFLIVDDDHSIAEMTSLLLTTYFSGAHVVVAASGEEALKALEECTFDLVITDHHMPGMGGLAFVRSLRSRDRDLPVILRSGLPNVESHALVAGASAFVVSVEIGRLLGIARSLLSRVAAPVAAQLLGSEPYG